LRVGIEERSEFCLPFGIEKKRLEIVLSVWGVGILLATCKWAGLVLKKRKNKRRTVKEKKGQFF